MYANFCTHVYKFNRSRLVVFVLVLAVSLLSTSVLAQNGRSNSKSTDAVLHIKVNVVPVVMLPAYKRAAESSTVTYNFTNQQKNMDVMEEIRPLLGAATGSGSSNSANAVLKTVTIVVQ